MKAQISEINLEGGGGSDCGGDSIFGGQDNFGQDAIDAYEGAIGAGVYVIERTVNAVDFIAGQQ